MMVVAPIQIFTKAHRTIRLKWINLFVCKLYLYEAVKTNKRGHKAVCSENNLKVISINKLEKKPGRT